MLNFGKANCAVPIIFIFREKNEMELKFRVRKVGKFEYTSRGCSLLVEIQGNGVPIVTDNFRMESAPF